MVITAKMVAELRERTGAGMMACKKALTEADGKLDKAIEILREKGLAAAAKKAGRIAAEGLVETYISEDGKTGSIVEVNCETDFVATNKDFVALTKNIAKQAAMTNADNIDDLLNEKYIADNSITVKGAVTALIAKLGENMSFRRFKKFTTENGILCDYIHGGGRIAVLVQLEGANNDAAQEAAKEIALQVAATNPLFINSNEVDEETLNKEREIYRQQALNEGKPEKIIDKIVEGKINKYYKEVCLIEQPWIKDQDKSVKKFMAEKSKEANGELKVARFSRFEKGEGIEKKKEDFAAEVRSQMK